MILFTDLTVNGGMTLLPLTQRPQLSWHKTPTLVACLATSHDNTPIQALFFQTRQLLVALQKALTLVPVLLRHVLVRVPVGALTI